MDITISLNEKSHLNIPKFKDENLEYNLKFGEEEVLGNSEILKNLCWHWANDCRYVDNVSNFLHAWYMCIFIYTGKTHRITYLPPTL